MSDFCKKEFGIGECKARPIKVAKRVKNYLKGDVHLSIIDYYYSPHMEKYLKEKHLEIKSVKSFKLEMKYSIQI